MPMSRSHLAAGTLAAALAFSTVVVPASPAVAQSSGSSTSTVDQQGFEKATAKWEGEREGVAESVDKLRLELSRAQQHRDAAAKELEKADGALDAAEEALGEAERKYALADVESRERDLKQAEEAAWKADQALREKQQALATAEQEAEDRAEDVAQARELAKRRGQEAAAAAARAAEAQQADDAARIALGDVYAREEAGADYTQADWERLAAEAIVEITNEYRQRHGMHPLVSHDVFNDNAYHWSGVMAADMERTGDLAFAFRHAEFADYGHSGENIVPVWLNAPAAEASREQWKHVPERAFTKWRDSTAHNNGLLAEDVTGIGVGLRTTQDGMVFATMQFYEITTPTDVHVWGPDDGSKRANESGKPYYVPSGAREALRVPPLTVDLNDRNGANTNYTFVIESQINSVQQASPRRLGAQLSHDYAAEIAAGSAAIDATEQRLTAAQERDAKAQALLANAQSALSQTTTALGQADAARDTMYAEEKEAGTAAAAARERRDSAEANLEWARTADRDALANDIDAAQERVRELEQASEDAYLGVGTAQEAVDEISDQLSETEAALAQVDRKRPTKAAFTTTETNTTAVVLGVLAALAVIGIGVVALAPQLGIQLPW